MTEFFKPEDFRPYLISEDAAAIANRILQERGVRVYGRDGGSWNQYTQEPLSESHQALLVGVEPVVRDTAESLLREFVNCTEGAWVERVEGLLLRARKVLSK